MVLRGELMKKKSMRNALSLLLVIGLSVSLMLGCNKKTTKEKQTIQVYLWTTSLYEKYAPYIQSQLPDMNIEFIVGNNDLDFYTFLDKNGGLPDIITNCRFSLHDASPLKNHLMDLSTTNVAGAVYNSYLNNFMNQDGSVNWLPVCADAHGFVVNKDLFEQYNIPLPTDYDSFVNACKKFEEAGIRGFVSDYMYDYTCMETLQGLSANELSSSAGRKWRTAYSDTESTEKVGLDETVWPGAFERLEQFIQDTKLSKDDLALNYDDVMDMFQNAKVAMYFGSSAGVKINQEHGINTIFLPFFEENSEGWLMTTPFFQVALNKNLEKDEDRRNAAMKVLNTMLSADAQNIIADGQDTLSYSQDVPLVLTDYLKDVKDVVEENHMYIRIASNDFFRISQDVVSKMIAGEYGAQEAYEDFNTQLKQEYTNEKENIVLTPSKAYSSTFECDGGNEAYSVMANTLRNCYQSDVLIATANSFTANVLQAEYTEKMAGYMIMPNSLSAYHKQVNGTELTDIVKCFVEGIEGGFVPFNQGSLPVFSGISVEVKEENGCYTLVKIMKDGKRIDDHDTFTLTCLATEKNMTPLLNGDTFTEDEIKVRRTWLDYVSSGNGKLVEPEKYITVRNEK